MMLRRSFLASSAAAVLAPGLAQPQQVRALVTFLWTQDQDASLPLWDAFMAGAGDLGWSLGREFTAEHAWSYGVDEQLPALARALVRRAPVVIVAEAARGALVAAEATSLIPIVAPTFADPLATQLVGTDFGHPKGNVTGILVTAPNSVEKQLVLTKQLVPSASRVGYLTESAGAVGEEFWRVATAAASVLNLRLIREDVAGADDLARAFGALLASGVEVIVVPPLALFTAERRQIVTMQRASRLPVVSSSRLMVEEGGLASVGGDNTANYRKAAELVAAVVKGVHPRDLPVLAPAPVLSLNLTTARQIGLAIPASVLAVADVVIE